MSYSMHPLEAFFRSKLRDIQRRLSGFTKAERLEEIARLLSERGITTITAQELYDKLMRTPLALVEDYTKIMQEIIKDNLEEIESVVALETSIQALKNIIATAEKQDIIKTAVDTVKTAVNTVKTVSDGIKVGTDKLIDEMASQAKQLEVKAQIGKSYIMVASDTIQLEDLDEEGHAGTEEQKRKQFTLGTAGTVRVTFEMKVDNVAYTAYIYIKVNDILAYTESTQLTDYTPKTQDVVIGVGDKISLWTDNSSADGQTWIRNARIKGTQEVGAPPVGQVDEV